MTFQCFAAWYNFTIRNDTSGIDHLPAEDNCTGRTPYTTTLLYLLQPFCISHLDLIKEFISSGTICASESSLIIVQYIFKAPPPPFKESCCLVVALFWKITMYVADVSEMMPKSPVAWELSAAQRTQVVWELAALAQGGSGMERWLGCPALHGKVWQDERKGQRPFWFHWISSFQKKTISF